MLYLKILFILLSVFLIQCSQKTSNEKKSKLNKKLEYITNIKSFNPESGELLKDKYTLLLYNFNEGRDQFVFDNSGNENDGIITNGKWVDGFIGKAIHLSGINSSIVVANKKSLNPSHALTIEMLINLSSNQHGGYPTILTKPSQLETGSGSPSYSFWIVNAHHDGFPLYTILFRINFKDNKEYDLDSQIPWKSLADEWHHIAGTYDGNKINFYIDGKLVSSKSYQDEIKISKEELIIGRNFWAENSSNVSMIIDEMRVSNIARSADSIKTYWDYIKFKYKK